jgi:hypothetical protein
MERTFLWLTATEWTALGTAVLTLVAAAALLVNVGSDLASDVSLEG